MTIVIALLTLLLLFLIKPDDREADVRFVNYVLEATHADSTF